MILAGLMVVAAALGGCASESETPGDDAALPAEEAKVVVDEDTASPPYGSGFASNCSCAFCTRYCTVDGTTHKNGTCC